MNPRRSHNRLLSEGEWYHSHHPSWVPTGLSVPFVIDILDGRRDQGHGYTEADYSRV